MIKNNKGKAIVSSLLILLPIVVGLLLWNKLPERIAIHWGSSGEPDGWSGKAFAVFFFPLILLAFHWLCLLITRADVKNKNQHKKVFGLIWWILPMLSLALHAAVYATALQIAVSVPSWITACIGVLFVVIGNYMPKCKQNHTIGIKVKWTLENEENWNATHRVAGRVWLVGGFLLIPCAFLPPQALLWVLFPVTAVMAIVPFVYSYRYHKKHS